mmetsp:Transcript_37012/g.86051  ORF Transcript_37012/g.86051 Transcript_37012/m.86051 type:complete len:222 (-) Transcript_37012:465-1130(-)
MASATAATCRRRLSRQTSGMTPPFASTSCWPPRSLSVPRDRISRHALQNAIVLPMQRIDGKPKLQASLTTRATVSSIAAVTRFRSTSSSSTSATSRTESSPASSRSQLVTSASALALRRSPAVPPGCSPQRVCATRAKACRTRRLASACSTATSPAPAWNNLSPSSVANRSSASHSTTSVVPSPASQWESGRVFRRDLSRCVAGSLSSVDGSMRGSLSRYP